MGVSRANSAAEKATQDGRPASPVELVELVLGQVLTNDAALEALPTILGLLVALFDGQAAVAFQEGQGDELVVLAAHPGQAGADEVLLAELSALSAQHRDVAGAGGYFLAPLQSAGQLTGRPASVLVAFSAPDSGPCLCAVALVGDSARWNADSQATTRALAAIVAIQIRHANDTAELAERQMRSAALVDRSPNGMIVVSSDGRLVVFNRAAEEMTGWRQDELRGKLMVDVLIPERDRDAVAAVMATYLESGDPEDYGGSMRMPLLRADGTECMVEMTPVPVTIEGQAHFCAFLRDIDELERALAALLESEARLKVLSQLAPVGIMQTSLDGLTTFVNGRWCELTGLTERDAVGSSWSIGFHPDDVQRIEMLWRREGRRAGEMRTDCRLRPAGQDLVWAHLAVVPVSASDGRPIGFLAAITNVSDRKRAAPERERLLAAERAARHELADQTERLNGLIQAAIPGILVENEHGRVTQINQSFCDMFGIEGGPSRLIGRTSTRIAIRIRRSFADPDEFLRRADELLAGRRPVAEQEIATADGRTFECDFTPVFVDGSYRGIMWGVADVTHRQVMKEERERLLKAELAAREAAEEAQNMLAEKNAKLQEIDEAKTQFMATMSHELRTPLTSIVSFTELILDDEEHELTPDTVSSLYIIQRNAERLLQLVGDLLLLSKLEAGGLSVEFGPVAIPDLIAAAIRSISATAAEHDITVEIATADGPPIQADQLRLEQVMDNLLSNAIKFSGQGGRVRVEAAYDDQMWRVDVTDEGIGIPADELDQLFSRFMRASNARVAGVPGTGLGLSVVKAIVELHRGRVEVQSTIGRGTTLSVYLPASA